MSQISFLNRFSFLTDLLFIVADLWAVSVYRDFFMSGNVEVLLIIEFGVFVIYAFMIRICQQWPEFLNAHKELEEKIPALLFWLKLGHVFVFIYIPVGLMIFLSTVAGEYTGDGEFILIIFLLLPVLPILIGWGMGSHSNRKQANRDGVNTIYRIGLNAGFIIVFAFIDITFKKLGDWICLELTREITGNYAPVIEPLMILQVVYMALFIWFVYIPVRMWLLVPFYRDRLKLAGFILSIIILLINGIFADALMFWR